MTNKTISVLGGAGFVGSHLVARLNADGHRVKVATRRRERHKALTVLPNVKLMEGNVHDEGFLERFFADSDVVVNLVAILNEAKRSTFDKVHVDLPKKIVSVCKKQRIPHLLHMSALNADFEKGTSRYLRTRGEGEELVRERSAGIRVNILRPSVIFGPGDHLFNRFAGLLRIPGPIPVACPNAKFAPVYVGDVVDAYVELIDDLKGDNKTHDLCGPREMTLLDMFTYVDRILGTRKNFIPLNDGLSGIFARLLAFAPGKPMTYDNYLSTKLDNVCPANPDARFTPQTPIEAVVPDYIGRETPRDYYDDFRTNARHEA